jgi:hypothetical protein
MNPVHNLQSRFFKVKKILLLSMRHKHLGRIQSQVYSFLSLALDGGEWLVPPPVRFTPREKLKQPLKMRLGGLQDRNGHFGKTKNVCVIPAPTTWNVQWKIIVKIRKKPYIAQ